MVKVIDRRKIAIGGHSKRQVGHIRNIAVHYSATATGNTASFERYWKNSRDWVTGGYHEVVLLNGNVELNYDATVISNGVLGHNTGTYNICYVGAGNPNSAQLKTIRNRVSRAKSTFKVNNVNIKGHREFSGSSTSCPALNVRVSVVNKLKSNVVKDTINKVIPKPKPKVKGYTERIQRKLNEYRVNNIKVDDRYGPETHKALIKAYQYELNRQFSAGLVVDGIPGRKTDNAAITLRYSETKGNIAYLTQAMLFFKGYKLSVDGYWQDISVEMTKVFQRHNRLTQDGIPGKATYKPLIRR